MAPTFDEDDLVHIDEVIDQETLKAYSPPRREKIRYYTVGFLILNRTIGSGIFVTSATILQNTRSPGISLIFWAAGGLLSLCVVLVWLEFGLSTPRKQITGGITQCVPRSGGEKNYLELALRKPKFLATCLYGIPFILLGNLAGNSLAFGRYVMLAAGYSDANGELTASQGSITGIAIGALTLIMLVHMSSRRGGIILNDAFAVFKILLLVAIIVIGFVFVGGGLPQKDHLGGHNFDLNASFTNHTTAVSSYTQSLLLVMYSYSGYEQPFYVLSEVYRPKKTFAKTVIVTMLFTVVLFLLVNIAYLCVVPMETVLNAKSPDMATLFFNAAFNNSKVTRAMQGVVALAILGNIVVMTFTASRVKQELAKEGILPWSLVFATGRTTPISWLRSRFRRQYKQVEPDSKRHGENIPNILEQSPMAALGLQWLSSLLLLALTVKLSTNAYSFLIALYSYVIVVLIAFFTTTGLLYCKYIRKDWVGEFKPVGGPIAAIIYWFAALFVLITAFLKPANLPTYPYYLVPLIGLSASIWGLIWWLGMKLYMNWTGLRLIVTRRAYIQQEEENGEWTMTYEIVRHRWTADIVADGSESDEDTIL